jgi:hypothetical protein
VTKPQLENTDMPQDSTHLEPGSQRESEGAVDQPQLVRKFFDLPLGTRFRYVGSDTVWVSIDRSGCGTIAKWAGIESSPAMQSICAFAETKDECRTLEVEVVDLPNDEGHAAARSGPKTN